MKEFIGKKILLIEENLSVPFDKRVWREALTLSETGAEVSIICPKYGIENKSFEILENICIFRYDPSFSKGNAFGYIKEYWIAFLKTVMLILSVYKKMGRIDVIHVANPPDIFWPIAILCKAKGVKFIFDEHDSAPELYLSRFNIDISQGKLFYILNMFQKLTYRFSDAIIATNESYKEKAIQNSPQFEKKTFVVRNGPDTRCFKSRKINNDLKNGFKYMAAYIGVMARQDGVDYIINAVHYLVEKKNFTDLIVYLIGSGDDIPYLKQLTKSLNLDKYIKFTGRIPDKPALEILSTADIGLSPDPFNPLNDISTMNKIMEYMCLGKPIVSFNLREARYSAQDAAIYVENNNIQAFADGILDLLNDKKKSIKMSEFGMARVEKELSWQTQSQNLINVYKYIFSF